MRGKARALPRRRETAIVGETAASRQLIKQEQSRHAQAVHAFTAGRANAPLETGFRRLPRLAQRLDRLLALWDRGGAHDLDIEAALLEGLAGADHDLIRAYAERPLSGVLIIASNSAELGPDIVDGRITKYLFPCERPQAHASSLVVRVRRSRERLGGVIDPFPPSDGSPSEIGEHHQRNQ